MGLKLLNILIFSILIVNSVNAHQHRIENLSKDIKDSGYKNFIFVFGGILLVSIIRHIFLSFDLSIPYAIFALLFGLLWGIIGYYEKWFEEKVEFCRKSLNGMLAILIPTMLFQKGFCIDAHAFLKALPQILIISIAASFLNAVVTGLLMRQVINSQWHLIDGILLGVMSIAIYSTTMMRWFRENTSKLKYFQTITDGEVIFTTALSLSLYQILLCHKAELVVEWYQYCLGLLREIVTGIPLGYIFGYIGITSMKLAANDILSLMVLSVATGYCSFYFGFLFSNCGVISCAVAAILMSREKTSLTKDTEEFLTTTWKSIHLIIDIILYIIIGALTPSQFIDEQLEVNDYFLILGTYLISNISRFVAFFLFSPLLSRIGYGMSFGSMIVFAWNGVRSPITIYMAYNFLQYEADTKKGKSFFLHTFGLFGLTHLINESFLPVLLKAIGLRDISSIKQINMNNCMNYINEARDRTIAILKMDRLLSDANWPLVMSSTGLKHPYKTSNSSKKNEDIEEEEDENNTVEYRFTYCPDCQKNIPKEATEKEMKEMTKEAKMRVLKHKQIIFSRLYQDGSVSKDGTRILHQAVEIAMDSAELEIETDELVDMFSKEKLFCKNLLQRMQIKTQHEVYKLSNRQWSVKFHRLIQLPIYRSMTYLIALSNFITIVYYLIVEKSKDDFLILFICNVIWFLAYFTQFWFKIFAYAWKNICCQSFQIYFSSFWNILEFFVLLTTSGFVIIFVLSFIWKRSIFNLLPLEILQSILLVLYIFGMINYWILISYLKKLIVICMINKIDKRKAIAYELGKNYVIAQDELVATLRYIIDNDKIRQTLKEKMDSERLKLTKLLGLAQMHSPWVTSKVKTAIAIRCVLHGIKNELTDLKVSGWVDDLEYEKLLNCLLKRFKDIRRINYITPTKPKDIFQEVLYMNNDPVLIEFLYSHICTRKFDPGHIIIEQNRIPEGIYILITGMFKIVYNFDDGVEKRMKELGALPVIDHIRSSTYNEDLIEFITPGNTLGELSLITERPYDGYVFAETHSEAYLLKNDIIKEAMLLDPDPINGFECRLWKIIAFTRIITVITNTPIYHSLTPEQIKLTIESSFVPNLSNFKIFVVNEMIQDIFLIEGIAVDYNTRDTYTAPCYIPRSVQKLMLPPSSLMNVDMSIKTKLLVIPAKDWNEYDIMINVEAACELVDKSESKCLLHYIQTKKMQNREGKPSSLKSRLVNFRKRGAESHKSKTVFGGSRLNLHTKLSLPSKEVQMKL